MTQGDCNEDHMIFFFLLVHFIYLWPLLLESSSDFHHFDYKDSTFVILSLASLSLFSFCRFAPFFLMTCSITIISMLAKSSTAC